ncbi:MAG: hypothetical protein PGN09_06385 [Sphingomonas fennica]
MRRAGVIGIGLMLAAAAPPAPIDLPGARLHPESVSIAPGGVAYVGSMTGGVLRVTLATGDVAQFVPPGGFGTGALFGVFADPVNRMLWTCTNDFSGRGVSVAGSDPGSVLHGFDLATGRGRIRLPLPGDKPICNDIAVARDGTIYVTDTSAPVLLRWRKGAAGLEEWVRDPVFAAGLDGIALGGDGDVYVNNVRTGALFGVRRMRDGRAGAVTPLLLSKPLVAPDGMRSLGGSVFVVAGGGRVDRVTIEGDRAMVETLAEGIDGITGVDHHKGTIWYSRGQLGPLFNPASGPPAPFRLTPLAAR